MFYWVQTILKVDVNKVVRRGLSEEMVSGSKPREGVSWTGSIAWSWAARPYVASRTTLVLAPAALHTRAPTPAG